MRGARLKSRLTEPELAIGCTPLTDPQIVMVIALISQ